MLNILSLKKKQKEAAQGSGKPKTTAAQIRIQKGRKCSCFQMASEQYSYGLDLSELESLPKSIQMTFPDPNDVFSFTLTLRPDDGERL
jgi:ubiquitin-conjugating enzyme E2 M